MTEWLPGNRVCHRICAVLHVANQNDVIDLSFNDAIRVSDALYKPVYPINVRRYFGRLWRKHGGLKLAEKVEWTKKIPNDVLEELNDQEQTA